MDQGPLVETDGKRAEISKMPVLVPCSSGDDATLGLGSDALGKSLEPLNRQDKPAFLWEALHGEYFCCSRELILRATGASCVFWRVVEMTCSVRVRTPGEGEDFSNPVLPCMSHGFYIVATTITALISCP